MGMLGPSQPFRDQLRPPRTVKSVPRSFAVNLIFRLQKKMKVNQMRRDYVHRMSHGLPDHTARALALRFSSDFIRLGCETTAVTGA